MRLIPRTTVALALALALCGCGAAPQPAANPSVAAVDASPGPVAMPASTPVHDPLAGLDCEPARPGMARACKAPGFDVSGTQEPCTGDSTSFGVVQGTMPLPAHDRMSEGARPLATLAPGQFVCIQFNADPVSGDGEGWMYVTAISPASVPACGKAGCGDPAAHSMWIDGRIQDCAVDGAGYSAGCPAGWVPSAGIDAYSMGL